MSSPSANAHILRRVLGCLILTTAIAGVVVSYTLLAVTFYPTGINFGIANAGVGRGDYRLGLSAPCHDHGDHKDHSAALRRIVIL
jgi:hypothetical protein